MFQRGLEGQNSQGASITKEQFILWRQATLMNHEGPTLGQFVEPPDTSNIFTEEYSPDGKSHWISLRNDNNTNVRLFYYCLLCLCFEPQCHKEGQPHSQQILMNLKLQLYNETLILDRFNPQEIDERYRGFYTDNIFKKIMVEFLQLMHYSEYSVMEMLRRYPIIDTIMIVLIRSLLGSTTIKLTTIKTQLLADYLHNVLGMWIIRGSHQYNLVGTRITVIEQELYSFVVREQLHNKARRSSLYNNCSQSQNRTSDLWDDLRELSKMKGPARPEKVSRLTGLELQTSSKKQYCQETRGASQKCKQSLDPMMSLDLDNILIIPKQPTLSIYDEDVEVLTIPKMPIDETTDSTSKNQSAAVTHFIGGKGMRPYGQAARMTEDPRLYLSLKTGNQLPKPQESDVLSTPVNIQLISQEQISPCKPQSTLSRETACSRPQPFSTQAPITKSHKILLDNEQPSPVKKTQNTNDKMLSPRASPSISSLNERIAQQVQKINGLQQLSPVKLKNEQRTN